MKLFINILLLFVYPSIVAQELTAEIQFNDSLTSDYDLNEVWIERYAALRNINEDDSIKDYYKFELSDLKDEHIKMHFGNQFIAYYRLNLYLFYINELGYKPTRIRISEMEDDYFNVVYKKNDSELSILSALDNKILEDRNATKTIVSEKQYINYVSVLEAKKLPKSTVNDYSSLVHYAGGYEFKNTTIEDMLLTLSFENTYEASIPKRFKKRKYDFIIDTTDGETISKSLESYGLKISTKQELVEITEIRFQ